MAGSKGEAESLRRGREGKGIGREGGEGGWGRFLAARTRLGEAAGVALALVY